MVRAVGLFGRSKVVRPDEDARLSRLEGEVVKLASALRQLETEQITMHDQVRRWMRRAVAAERAVELAHEPHPDAPTTPGPAPRPQMNLWGARARRAARVEAARGSENNGAREGSE